MNGSLEATDWRMLREFAAVDLTQSYVLSWHMESETLFVDVDLFLTPEHPSDENLHATASGLDQGSIESFRRLADGRYEISGEFGNVLVNSERPLLRLKGP